jgi:hypothetical protein
MQHENDGKQLKQERKCEYKTLALHVLINEIFSFLFSIKGNSKETKSRDLVCLLVQTKPQGCITFQHSLIFFSNASDRAYPSGAPFILFPSSLGSSRAYTYQSKLERLD